MNAAAIFSENVSSNVTEDFIPQKDRNIESQSSSDENLMQEVTSLPNEDMTTCHEDDTAAVLVNQLAETNNEVDSDAIPDTSFDESNLPFPSASRVKMTQSSKEGDLSSSWSPKLVRKRSKKERPGGNKGSKYHSMSEIETADKPTSGVDLFSNDIFQNESSDPPVPLTSELPLLKGMNRSQSQHAEQPISEHISR